MLVIITVKIDLVTKKTAGIYKHNKADRIGNYSDDKYLDETIDLRTGNGNGKGTDWVAVFGLIFAVRKLAVCWLSDISRTES